MIVRKTHIAKPFLKWAGGKTQLLGEIRKYFEHGNKEHNSYVEPFVGSGAVLFWLLQEYPQIKFAAINDVNSELMACYEVIRDNSKELIKILAELENDYNSDPVDEDKRKEIYYRSRLKFNEKNSSKVEQVALFIFLNRTCFNGLYRVNKSGKFNVPQGRYLKPRIYDSENLLHISVLLDRVEILSGDFAETIKYAGSNAFFYLDPPYKPVSATSNFTSYANQSFNDSEQIRLKTFCDDLAKTGARWLLSNSDSKVDNNAGYFDGLYTGRRIKRISARRNINSKATNRGKIKELLISNF